MPHVSKNKVKKDVFLRISEQLIDIISRIKTSRDSKRFLNELLTQTEHTMLSKRLAIIVMLHRGHTFNFISKHLKVSESTISRLWRRKKNNEFSLLVEKIEKDRIGRKFLVELETSLRFKLPPISGPGRWSGVLSPYDYKKRTKKKK